MTRWIVFRQDRGSQPHNRRGDGVLWEHLAGGLTSGLGYVDAECPEEAVRRALMARGSDLAPDDVFEVYPVAGAVVLRAQFGREWEA